MICVMQTLRTHHIYTMGFGGPLTAKVRSNFDQFRSLCPTVDRSIPYLSNMPPPLTNPRPIQPRATLSAPWAGLHANTTFLWYLKNFFCIGPLPVNWSARRNAIKSEAAAQVMQPTALAGGPPQCRPGRYGVGKRDWEHADERVPRLQ